MKDWLYFPVADAPIKSHLADRYILKYPARRSPNLAAVLWHPACGLIQSSRVHSGLKNQRVISGCNCSPRLAAVSPEALRLRGRPPHNRLTVSSALCARMQSVPQENPAADHISILGSGAGQPGMKN